MFTGYGKFNYLLLLAVVPAGFSSVYGSTAMSYVLPSAECDLGLTLLDKGLLNSMTFAGKQYFQYHTRVRDTECLVR